MTEHPNPIEIMGILKKQRYSVRNWALEHGYRPSTVQETLKRHVFPGIPPKKGKVIKKIIKDLSKTVGHDLTPP